MDIHRTDIELHTRSPPFQDALPMRVQIRINLFDMFCMREFQLLLLVAAVASAIPLPSSAPSAALLSLTAVQSDVAAGREALADVTIHAFEATNATVWITVRSNASAQSTTSRNLCDFAASCPLSAGLHTIRVPALLPRSSAPGSYVIGVSLTANDLSAPKVSLNVHQVLRVRGCPPCGSVLTYTRNGTPGTPPSPSPSPYALR
jgi:hypothetical protein